jgi:hypothetical protein
MANIDRIRRAVGKFAKLVPTIDRPKEFIHAIPDIRDRKKASSYEWSAAPGVYVFYNDAKIQYIGKAKARTRLQRV